MMLDECFGRGVVSAVLVKADKLVLSWSSCFLDRNGTPGKVDIVALNSLYLNSSPMLAPY